MGKAEETVTTTAKIKEISQRYYNEAADGHTKNIVHGLIGRILDLLVWQPIEDAPRRDCDKGCVCVLGKHNGGNPIVMFWWENQEGWFSFESSKRIEPTHWMEIPQ